MQTLVIILSSYLLSVAIFILSVVKGGINRKYLYTDAVVLGTISSLINMIILHFTNIYFWILEPFVSGIVVLILYIIILLFRFYRNPKRIIPGDRNDICSGADGRIIYIKELEANQLPVTVKKLRIINISEITKTDILKQPCYLIGIAMTLFDVHMNRSPIDGKIILVKHTKGTKIGLNTPASTITNERNTIVIKRDDELIAGIVQIAARGAGRCMVMNKEGDTVSKGQIIGKIRWGSQLDMIIPRNTEIFVREGDQVFAGSTIIGKYLGE